MIREVSRQIKERTTSPEDVVKSCLERIQTLNPVVNAFITVLSDEALAQAAAAEAELAAGRWRGPLHGIPVGIKDFYDTAGVRTTAAFEHFKNRVPQKDAVAVRQLKDAGAILIGKTNMHTLGMGTTGLESAFGPVKNPRNNAYIPGGSSSGSAAAVATGMCLATLDTDAIGSCRLPSACCGVVGFKGTYGLISAQGVLEGEGPPDETIVWLAHPGITTRSALDTALVLETFGVASDSDHGPLRIGVANNITVDKEIEAAFGAAVDLFRRSGHTLKSVAAPLVDMSRGIENIERDREVVAADVFGEIDVILLPTTTTTVPTVAQAKGKPQALSPHLTLFANYYGLPAVSVPCGSDSKGLPLGLQIVGRPREDGIVLRIAQEYERGC